MSVLPSLEVVAPDIVTLRDHEIQAATRFDPGTWAYLHGGAGDEITARENSRAWEDLRIVPRVLRRLSGGHTRLEMLGRSLAHPIMLAPVALQALAHRDGELATAHAAAAQGAGLVVSTQASRMLEEIANPILSNPGSGPLWFQLYLQPDREFNRNLVLRAERAGYQALVLTVDAPSSGARDGERRTNFRLPQGVRAVNLDGLASPQIHALQAGQSPLFDGLLKSAPTWDDVAWLRSITALPLLIKGILHPDDAIQARNSGANGVIVSNHGGRTLDTAVATATALPAVADALQGELAILVDGGIRRGTDVLKALALGADAVLVGRPIVHGLANAGARGVAHVIRLLRDELEIAMALAGCATLADINASCLTGKA